jgi:hypothetical protein
VLPAGVKRHEWKGSHGYRKAFKSRAEQVMRPANVEILMGHDIGVSESYWRPTEHELLEDYLKAVPLLSILENPNCISSIACVLSHGKRISINLKQQQQQQ